MAERPFGRYQIVDLELNDGIDDLVLPAGATGAAVLIRQAGRPITFWMEAVPDGRLSAAHLAARVPSHAGARVMPEANHHESAAAPLPFVTVAICTKDRPAGIERLLRSLAGQARGLPPGSPGLEILVVDNAPSDQQTRAIVDRWPEVRYVLEPLPGLNFARNRALQHARGDLLAFLDDDVTADRGWLAGLAAAWRANMDAVAFTGLVLPMEVETEAQYLFELRGGFRRGCEPIRFGRVLPNNRSYPGDAGRFGTGANMAFNTRALRDLGGFDEALDAGAPLPGGGDLDIFYRIIRAGHPLVYEPRLLVFHQHRREMSALRSQYRDSWGYGFMCYATKCLKTDPTERVTLVRLVLWWFASHLIDLGRQSRRRSRGEVHLPPGLLWSELGGAIRGLFGGYGRSLRRVNRLRAESGARRAD